MGSSIDSTIKGAAWIVVAALFCSIASGCATTQVPDREKIADEAMYFDSDGSVTFLREKVEAAREGALGGYGGAAAGGCGCQ